MKIALSNVFDKDNFFTPDDFGTAAQMSCIIPVNSYSITTMSILHHHIIIAMEGLSGAGNKALTRGEKWAMRVARKLASSGDGHRKWGGVRCPPRAVARDYVLQ